MKAESRVEELRSGASHMTLGISTLRFQRMFILFLTLPIALYVVVALYIWGAGAFSMLVSSEFLLETPLALLAIFVSHEFLHIIAFRATGVRHDRTRFQVEPSSLSVSLRVEGYVTTKAWRTSLLTPLLVITFTLIAAAVAFDAWVKISPLIAFSLSGCAFDIVVYIALKGIPGELSVKPEIDQNGNSLRIQTIEEHAINP